MNHCFEYNIALNACTKKTRIQNVRTHSMNIGIKFLIDQTCAG